ncbi:hypothetical protein [Halorhodospira halochloris]|uniref:hypothetical protein n=1 Tax=Halorhodospira halochloris TaxID=1052 RepID=UPI001EE7BD91|nr:hypothetical protein [Halorhodospira halochloris]MCG5547311.1 hypothetical protein [Halorhodospira halochloris]
MTKKRLLSCLILGSAPLLVQASDEEYYQGSWEQTTEDARTSLAQNIFVRVDSEIQREVDTEIFDDTIRDEERYEERMRQETTLDLTGVEIEEDSERGYRARISRDDFNRQATRSKRNFHERCVEDNLPSSWDSRRDFIMDCYRDANAVLAMTSVAGLGTGQVSSMLADFSDWSEQGLLVVSTSPDKSFRVDGQTYKYGQEIPLSSGSYTISWDNPGYCPVEKEVEVEAGEITEASKELDELPTIAISSRTPGAQLTIDGRSRNLGQTYTQDSCSGEVAYQVSNDFTSQERTVNLEPGLEYTNTVNIMTADDAQRLEELASSYRADTRYRLLVGYSYEDDLEDAYRVRLEQSTGRGAVRYGYGVSYGWNDATEIGFYAQAALQLAQWGGKPLHLTPKFGFIPYAGLELGLAYHEREDSDGSSVDSYGSDWHDDYVLFRYIAGLDIPVDEYLGFSLQIAKATTMEESWESSFGLTIAFD